MFFYVKMSYSKFDTTIFEPVFIMICEFIAFICMREKKQAKKRHGQAGTVKHEHRLYGQKCFFFALYIIQNKR